MNEIAIVILNYNTWEDTLLEINICKNVLGVNPKNIIVIDNDSPNNSYEVLQSYKNIGFKLIKASSNKGYAAGNNLGMKYALENGYSYALILNNDILIKNKYFISEMLNTFRKDTSIAIVSPRVYTPEGKEFSKNSVRPTFLDFTFFYNRYRKKSRIVNDEGGYAFVYQPQGCCMMVDLKKMKEFSFMDENTFLYGEELILGERMIEKDYKCVCCLKCDVIHNHSKTVKSVLSKRRILKINNESLNYYMKNYRQFNAFQRYICLLFNSMKWLILS